MLKSNVFFLLFSILFFTTQAQSKADKVCGLYYATSPHNGESSQLQIYKTKNGTYEGKVVWMEFPNHPNGEPRRDVKNPDPDKRSQTNVGMVLIKGFTYNEATNEWENGEIYNPESGKTYRCFMKLESDNKLKVRGYLGISLLGKTVVWTRETVLRK
jgi:uncharacterized protein (DUF2147 family)